MVHELHSMMKGRPVSHPLHVVDSANATVSSLHSGSSSSITCGSEGAGRVQPWNDNDGSCSDDCSIKSGAKLLTSDHPPKQKKRKYALIAKVIQAQSEQQKKVEEMERERISGKKKSKSRR